MQDWHYIMTGTMDITVEVNDDKWPPESQLRRLWHEHRGAILAAADAACLRSLRGFVHVAAKSDGGSSPVPVPGAVMAVEGVGMHFTASALGYYARPAEVGTVRVTASAPGFRSQTLTAEVTAAGGAELDFALTRLGAGEAVEGGGLAEAAAAAEAEAEAAAAVAVASAKKAAAAAATAAEDAAMAVAAEESTAVDAAAAAVEDAAAEVAEAAQVAGAAAVEGAAAAVAAAAAVGVAVDDESPTGAGPWVVAAEAFPKVAVSGAAAETGEVAVAEPAVFPNGGSPQKDYEHIASDAVGAAPVSAVSAPEPEQRWLPAGVLYTGVCLGGLVCWLLLVRLRRSRRAVSRLQKFDAMMSRLPGGGSGGAAGTSSTARSSNNDGRV